MALSWLSEGRCENKGNEEMTVCIDGAPHKLAPGEKTPAGKDCDGYRKKDGTWVKVHGATRIESEKSEALSI